MAAPVSFREKVRFFSLAPRAPSIHGTERRSFGLNLMPGIGGAADLPRLDRTSKIGANDPQLIPPLKVDHRASRTYDLNRRALMMR